MEKHLIFAAAALFGLWLMGGLAIAQDMPDEPGYKTVYKSKTVIDFSDVTIEGELTKPEGSYLGTRKSSQFNKLILVREDFRPELLMSVDNL